MMRTSARRFVSLLAATLLAGASLAQGDPPKVDGATGVPPALASSAAAPASMAATPAPVEPRPDDTNAQRARSQPGNNAPFWRGVRESGNQPGITNL
ncbi:MAG: hypothetical protein ABIV63_05095, partial [Caldimonas sp.]